MAAGQRLAMGLQQAHARLVQPGVHLGRRRVDALAQDFRRGHALEAKQPPEGRIVAVGAHRLEVGLAQRQQRDLRGEHGRVGDALQARPEQRAQPRRGEQLRQCRQTGVAGQDKVGEPVLDPHAHPSLDRPIGIRTRRVNRSDRRNAPTVKGKPALARIVVTESGLIEDGQNSTL